MTDTSPKYRISPSQLCMSDAMPFQQHFEARVAGRDIKDVISDQLFLNVNSNLKVGDEIVLCGYADQTWQTLQQFARLRVTSVSREAIKLLQEGDVVEIPVDMQMEQGKKPESVVEVRRAFGGTFNVLDKKKDSVLESFKTKAEAEDWAKKVDPAFVPV